MKQTDAYKQLKRQWLHAILPDEGRSKLVSTKTLADLTGLLEESGYHVTERKASSREKVYTFIHHRTQHTTITAL